MPERRPRSLVAASLAAVLLLAPVTVLPRETTPPPAKRDVAEKQADLRELRAKIDELRKEIASAEGSRAEVADQLKDSERAISQLQRDLRDLGTQKRDLQSTLRSLGAEAHDLEKALATHQTQLERLLRSQYLQGAPDPLRLLLNGEDPNQLARDLYYLGAVAQARSDVLADVERLLERKKALAARTRNRADALATVEEKQKEKHAHLVGERQQQRATLSKIAAQIAAQKKEVGSLRRDEKRMTQLIDRLSRLIAARAKRAQEAAKATPPSGGQRQTPSSGGLENEMLPQAAPAGSFAKLRGRLRLPVKGIVSNRFGAARQEGSTWKGLFIRSDAGSDVKAIAGGRIVFADWMRGFGNLLIIDHGDAYLSIYGNNEAILKNVGDAVDGGDTVATVGNSGGNPESGLYFELRHQGQPVDPLKWASLK